MLNPTEASGKATERIMNEFKSILKTSPEKNGFTVAPIDDNLYKWELKLYITITSFLMILQGVFTKEIFFPH